MKLYKLTDENDRTHKGTQWGKGVTHKTNGKGHPCGPGWIHAYEDPLLAVLLNPIHGNFSSPHLWAAEGDGRISHDLGLKVGVTKLTTLRRLDLPGATTKHQIRFAILCAAQVYGDSSWRSWAQAWLDGMDSAKVAWATEAAAEAAAKAAWSAESAAEAAKGQGISADPTWVAWMAAGAAGEAAGEAAEAAGAAAWSAGVLELPALARRAVSEERIVLEAHP